MQQPTVHPRRTRQRIPRAEPSRSAGRVVRLALVFAILGCGILGMGSLFRDRQPVSRASAAGSLLFEHAPDRTEGPRETLLQQTAPPSGRSPDPIDVRQIIAAQPYRPEPPSAAKPLVPPPTVP